MTLIVMRAYSVDCEAPGCEKWSETVTPRADDSHKARTARRELAEWGWVYVGGKDYCPEHAPTLRS